MFNSFRVVHGWSLDFDSHTSLWRSIKLYGENDEGTQEWTAGCTKVLLSITISITSTSLKDASCTNQYFSQLGAAFANICNMFDIYQSYWWQDETLALTVPASSAEQNKPQQILLNEPVMQSTPQQVQITLHRYWKGQLVLNTDLNLCESDSTVWFSTFCELTQTQRAVSWEVLNEFEWYDEQCMPWVCFVGHAGAWHEILIAKGKYWL